MRWWNLFAPQNSYDLVIHAISVFNHSPEAVSLKSITIDGLASLESVQRVVIGEPEIRSGISPLIARQQMGLRKLVDFILGIDDPAMQKAELAPDLLIEPGRMLLYPSIYLLFHRLPDKIRVTVALNIGEVDAELDAEISVREYSSQVKYGFPLEGGWFLKGSPVSGIMDHHRFGYSNQFGVDLLRLGPEGVVFAGSGEQPTDYFSHGARVLAAADGRVAAVNQDEVQDWHRFNPRSDENTEQFIERQFGEVRQALDSDIIRWAAGNYVIIEHTPVEYSVYLHLKPGSFKVVPGQLIRRGQHIAEVGNTGDSYAAHLHFQVMDKPDLRIGRSLPFEFDNVEPTLSEPGLFIKPVPGQSPRV